jgi:hypothetical protein
MYYRLALSFTGDPPAEKPPILCCFLGGRFQNFKLHGWEATGDGLP